MDMSAAVLMEVMTADMMARRGQISHTYTRLMSQLSGLHASKASHNPWLFTVLNCITYKASYERNLNRGS